ncbi:hypothetical protein CERSUDRAFT_114533 [Gelatoporia subvermispora B]|uniref:Cyclin N-terminal domain-containing protein n=2 Tax=Gelatoporiaceae TaxID=2028217 RepID=M2RGH1_CERS8|nr:hypothetical protein CERSUDRAFT_114533 [Gelatoporia subvermispora B]
MHAVPHSLAHRGPSASRARSRWQPYATIATASSSRTPSNAYLNTPASSVASSTPPSVPLHPLSELERIRCHVPSHPHTTPSIVASLREAQKARYVGRLIDQAVQSLCDIWHSDDIPPAFSGARGFGADARDVSHPPHSSTTLFCTRNLQLPSPPPSPAHELSPTFPASDAREAHCPRGTASCGNVLPIKGFVHEVLRRSRTSTGVLQTALCYLEAVRMKVPELLNREKQQESCTDVGGGNSATPQIVQACPSACAEDPACAYSGAAAFSEDPRDAMDTVRVSDTGLEIASNAQAAAAGGQNGFATHSATHSAKPPLPPLPRQPSPLCCPRRTFLACLILASKFMQDRSYSNRAWAKLAGLPPREIGRCERAVGEALGWRLWVGKDVGLGSPVAAGAPGSSGRIVSRSRSDGDLLKDAVPAATADWLGPATYTAPPAPLPTPSLSPCSHLAAAANTSLPLLAHAGTGLRRWATVPDVRTDHADVFRTLEAFGAPFLADEPAPLPPYMQPDGYFYAAAPAQDSAHGAMQDVSPPVATPTLTYSPMSSASSSSDGPGDRTIQMTTFTDSPAPYAPPHAGPGAPWDAAGCAGREELKGCGMPLQLSGMAVEAYDVAGIANLALYGLSYCPVRGRTLAEEC